MSDVVKIATRDSYGNALAELGAEKDNLVVLDADLLRRWYFKVFQRTSCWARNNYKLLAGKGEVCIAPGGGSLFHQLNVEQ